MPEPQPDVEGLGPAAILVILVLGAALSLLLWSNVKRKNELDVERETQSNASILGHVVAEEIGNLTGGLRRRAQIWATQAYETNPEIWSDDVDLFLSENPGILAVLRADPTWGIAGTADGKRILREVLPEARRREADADAEFVVGPIETSDGRNVFGIQVRASLEPRDTRTVFAVFDAPRVIADLLDTRAPGFAIAIGVDGRELYHRGGPATDPAHEFAKAESVSVSSGPSWTLEVWPETGSLLFSSQRGPAIALAIGLLGSALIAAAVHFGSLSWRRERMLRRVNAALEQQVSDTERGRGELRQLSEVLEARVAERTAELNETIVELETFNYSVSHDLRGPLGAVINFAAILAEDYVDKLDSTAKDYLQRIVGSASGAVSMMDALLAYSRSGRSELRKAPLDVERLVREVCASLISSPASCPVKIGELPDAYADENMMRFVFSNLIGNACKFTPVGEPPRVEVAGREAADEVEYYVRDEGVGFDMRFSDKLFKVFERLHPTESFGGHGVGLAIVARMVRRHGGRVWAQGAVGKGATFYFTLPIANAEDGDGRSIG